MDDKKPKKKRGKYHKRFKDQPEKLRKILELVRVGIPKTVAIRAFFPNVNSFYNWMKNSKEGREFKLKLDQADAEGEIDHTELFLEKLKETNNLDYFLKWLNIRYNRTMNLKYQIQKGEPYEFIIPSGLEIPYEDTGDIIDEFEDYEEEIDYED